MRPSQEFDEYKLFVENTQKLSERRQAATQTYLAINTAVFGVLAFLVKDAAFRGWWLVLAGLPLFGVGLVTCWLWHEIIRRFSTLDGWRYEQLRAMEDTMSDSYRLISKEWDEVFKKPGFGFSVLEVWVPRLVFLLYAVFFAGIIVATARGFR